MDKHEAAVKIISKFMPRTGFNIKLSNFLIVPNLYEYLSESAMFDIEVEDYFGGPDVTWYDVLKDPDFIHWKLNPDEVRYVEQNMYDKGTCVCESEERNYLVHCHNVKGFFKYQELFPKTPFIIMREIQRLLITNKFEYGWSSFYWDLNGPGVVAYYNDDDGCWWMAVHSLFWAFPVFKAYNSLIKVITSWSDESFWQELTKIVEKGDVNFAVRYLNSYLF